MWTISSCTVHALVNMSELRISKQSGPLSQAGELLQISSCFIMVPTWRPTIKLNGTPLALPGLDPDRNIFSKNEKYSNVANEWNAMKHLQHFARFRNILQGSEKTLVYGDFSGCAQPLSVRKPLRGPFPRTCLQAVSRLSAPRFSTRLHTSSFLPERSWKILKVVFIMQKLLAFYPLRSSAWIVMVLCHRDTLYLGLVLGHHETAQEHYSGIGDVMNIYYEYVKTAQTSMWKCQFEHNTHTNTQ